MWRQDRVERERGKRRDAPKRSSTGRICSYESALSAPPPAEAALPPEAATAEGGKREPPAPDEEPAPPALPPGLRAGANEGLRAADVEGDAGPAREKRSLALPAPFQYTAACLSIATLWSFHSASE